MSEIEPSHSQREDMGSEGWDQRPAEGVVSGLARYLIEEVLGQGGQVMLPGGGVLTRDGFSRNDSSQDNE